MTRVLVWFWSGGGGGSQFAARLAHRLRRDFGADGVALSMRSDDPTIASAAAHGVRVLRADVVSDRKRPWQTLTHLARGRDILQEHVRAANADIVLLAMNFAAAAPLSLALDQPLIYCAHDPEPHPGDFAPLMQRGLQAALTRRARKVVALSGYASDQLRRLGVPHGKLHTAPLASVFEPVTVSTASASEQTRFLMFGRMIAYKGLAVLADALPQLAARNDWRLTIAGAGPALDAAMMARLSAFPQVTVTPSYVPDAAMDALIDAHDVVIAPYLSATQSGVAAQAMARGRPIIATPLGALREQVGGGGWVTATASSAALAASFVDALDNAEARTAKGSAALALAQAAWQAPSWAWLETVSR